MGKRKGKLKAVGLIAVGFLTGSIFVGGLIAWRYGVMFKQQYYLQILENANVAHMIRADREEKLLEQIELGIQQYVLSADSLWGDDKDRLTAFWYVQGYYEKFDLEVPGSIQPILNSLPPRPPKICELKPLAEGDVEPNKAPTN